MKILIGGPARGNDARGRIAHYHGTVQVVEPAMLCTALLVAALASDPIGSALMAWAALDSYRVTMHSTLADGETQIVRYAWRKPGFVRMDFVRPHRGALLVYSPASGEAVLRPFGADAFPRLRLSPGNALIRSPSGHTVDRSDVGVLLNNARALQDAGTTDVVGTERIDGASAVHVRVTGAGGSAVDGVHRYDLWLAQSTLFPVRAESRDLRGGLVESVSMRDVELDVALPDAYFDG